MIDLATLADMLRALANEPIWLAIAIIAATFILEDAATIAAALLTVEGTIGWPLALGALYVGIFFGDLGLYGLGHLARRSQSIANRIGQDRIVKGRLWLDGRLTLALIGARFVPGLRLPAYTASGYLGVSLTRFTLIAALAAAIWTPLLFFVVVAFGSVAVDILGPWRYAVGLVLVGLAVFGPLLFRKVRAARS